MTDLGKAWRRRSAGLAATAALRLRAPPAGGARTAHRIGGGSIGSVSSLHGLARRRRRRRAVVVTVARARLATRPEQRVIRAAVQRHLAVVVVVRLVALEVRHELGDVVEQHALVVRRAASQARLRESHAITATSRHPPIFVIMV